MNLSSYFADAIRRVGPEVRCAPGRKTSNGPHETKEFGPAIQAAFREVLADARLDDRTVELNMKLPIKDFSRKETETDLVVTRGKGEVELIAELKCWDIGHQLFDLAKSCCLLNSGVERAFLVCAARRAADFKTHPGGELFPATKGETSEHRFQKLFADHPKEWRKHVGKDTPEPTSVPTNITTTAIATRISLDAYPGHEVRAVEVQITDPTPIELANGMPTGAAYG